MSISKAIIFCWIMWTVCHIQALEVSGVNQTIDEGFGSRYPGLSNTFLGIRGNETSLGYHPAAMNDVGQFWIGIEHASKWQTANYDNLSFIIPFDSASTMGFGLARYALGDQMLYYDDGKTYYGSDPDEIVNVADYMFVGAFARRFHQLNIGGNLYFLYRKLDQKGAGIRGDLSAQYTMFNRFLLGALLKGAVPSAARWESEFFEREPSDLYLGIGGEFPSEYFYGIFRFALQTKGLFQKQSKARNDIQGSRIHEKPIDILKTLNAGFEYKMNLGLVLRAGVPEIGASTADYHPSFGVGYNYGGIFKIDYSFIPHPELLSTHRISLSVSPSFKGKRYIRPGGRNALDIGDKSIDSESSREPSSVQTGSEDKGKKEPVRESEEPTKRELDKGRESPEQLDSEEDEEPEEMEEPEILEE